jgi:deoxycytidylate deaminase
MLPRLQAWRARGRDLLENIHTSQKIVAFVIRKNRVVSTGVNSYTKTHPRQAHYGKLAGQPKRQYLHAEIAALLRAPSDADTLVVIRVNKAGEFVNSKPCPVCALAIRHFNPEMKVIHT